MLKSNKICQGCGSSRIAGPHQVWGGNSRTRVILPKKTASLISFSCVDCGFTELYVDPKGLENINEFCLFDSTT
ncbi:MAG: zinc ribbon domain-containing protein [Candidatus Hodarchaeales archaeon]|jgi:predicted nucleic-acid-binding Zn-ribbon protein